MAKIMKNVNNEKYTKQDLDYDEKMMNVESETQTLFDLEYGQKH